MSKINDLLIEGEGFAMSIKKTTRPIGYHRVSQSVASDVRALLRSEGIEYAMELFQLSRMAVMTVAAEQQVQVRTLLAVQDGLKRVNELRAMP